MSKMPPDCTQCAAQPAAAGLGGWCQECEDDFMAQEMPPEAMEAPDEATRLEMLARFPWEAPNATPEVLEQLRQWEASWGDN